MESLLLLFLFFFGAIFGSFIGVVIYRLPLSLSIVYPNSFCHFCKSPIKFWQNIPVVSWIFLKGSCYRCKKFYGSRSFFLEIICGLSLIALFLNFGLSLALVEKFVFILILLCLAYIDLDTFILPPVLLMSLILWGGLTIAVYKIWPHFYIPSPNPLLTYFLPDLVNEQNFIALDRFFAAALGFLSLSSLNFVFTFIYRKLGRLQKDQWAMGWGDPLLVLGLGLFLGQGKLLFTILLASVLGVISSLVMKLFPQKSSLAQSSLDDEDIPSEAIPFGPFLAIAAIYFNCY